MAKAIFKLNVDCGRMGDLEGLFVAEKDHVEKLINDGIEVYFGEVLGKHSEICGAIEQKEITLVSDSVEAIQVIESLGLESGYNPFDYTAINVEDDEDDLTVLEIVVKRLNQ